MRKPLIALSLSVAALAASAATASVGAAGAHPASCPPVLHDRIDDALSRVAPPLPGATWKVGKQGNSVDCTLNWVQLDTDRGTGASPVQILLFDHQKYAGTVTEKPHAFTSVVGNAEANQIIVRFQWLNPGDASAAPTGVADVRFQTFSQAPVHAIDPLPPQVVG